MRRIKIPFHRKMVAIELLRRSQRFVVEERAEDRETEEWRDARHRVKENIVREKGSHSNNGMVFKLYLQSDILFILHTGFCECVCVCVSTSINMYLSTG